MGKKSDLVRKKIINEFYRLICEQGYNKTTLRQLANVCGISRGHIAFYFKKKEDLMLVIIQNYFLQAYTIIAEDRGVLQDELDIFLLHQLFLHYLNDQRGTVDQLNTAMSEYSQGLDYLVEGAYELVYSALEKIGHPVNKDDVLDSCLFSTFGVYEIIRKDFNNNQFDYRKYFTKYAKVLFIQLHFQCGNCYINRALQQFEELDKRDLLARFQFHFPISPSK